MDHASSPPYEGCFSRTHRLLPLAFAPPGFGVDGRRRRPLPAQPLVRCEHEVVLMHQAAHQGRGKEARRVATTVETRQALTGAEVHACGVPLEVDDKSDKRRRLAAATVDGRGWQGVTL